jgi:hypothetical protein
VKVRRRELLLLVLLTLLQAFGPRTGRVEPSSVVAGLVTVLGIVQGAAVLLWRDRPGRMLTVVTAAYVAAAILYPIMPPYVLLAALVLQARRRPFRPALIEGVGAIAATAVGSSSPLPGATASPPTPSRFMSCWRLSPCSAAS